MEFIDNRITQLLKIKYPIIEGGMAWVGTPKLAAAVSEAGGLGMIGSGSMNEDILDEKIERIKQLTEKPFGVNIMLLNPAADSLVLKILEKRVPVVVFGAGNPSIYLPDLKKQGIKVLSVVSSENLALMLEREGVDAVIGEGMESGGHIGQVTTMVLIPGIKAKVSIPVIAAGGIASGEGIAAAFALGAEGIQIGTRFIASEECEAHQNYKNLIIKSGIRDAVITGEKTGHPSRVIKTKFTRTIQNLESTSLEETEVILIGSLKRAFEDGNIESGSFMAGQSAGLIKEILPVKKIIENLINETQRSIEKMNRFCRNGGDKI